MKGVGISAPQPPLSRRIRMSTFCLAVFEQAVAKAKSWHVLVGRTDFSKRPEIRSSVVALRRDSPSPRRNRFYAGATLPIY